MSTVKVSQKRKNDDYFADLFYSGYEIADDSFSPITFAQIVSTGKFFVFAPGAQFYTGNHCKYLSTNCKVCLSADTSISIANDDYVIGVYAVYLTNDWKIPFDTGFPLFFTENRNICITLHEVNQNKIKFQNTLEIVKKRVTLIAEYQRLLTILHKRLQDHADRSCVIINSKIMMCINSLVRIVGKFDSGHYPICRYSKCPSCLLGNCSSITVMPSFRLVCDEKGQINSELIVRLLEEMILSLFCEKIATPVFA